MSSCSISVIIPVKNGAQTLHKCLSSINHQTIADRIAIIVLDSASTDSSKQIALACGAKVIDILPEEFNHGLTRNEGVKYAKGELLYFTVQDAYIADDDMLERMCVHFNDKEVQSVCAHQAIPHDLDKNPALWFKRITKPEAEVRYFPNGSFSRLTKKQQLSYSQWDNVCAMYRKEGLVNLPFKKMDYCEDCLWAEAALKSGQKIIRDPSLVVYHYHHHNFGYTYRSYFIINYYYFIFFNARPSYPKLFIPLLTRINTLRKEKALSIMQKLYWAVHNAGTLFAQWLSVCVFKMGYVFSGKEGVEKAYKIICKTVPQGKQKY
jgi:glycosyltransferase involved in cell wall biosynthesis